MKNIEESQVVPCDVETFWKTYLDEKFISGLYRDCLGFQSFEILELTPTSRKARIVPKMNLPGPLQKLVGDSFSYEDHGTLDRATNTWRWRMVQAPGKKEMVATSGSVRVEPAGDGKCRRVNQASIEGKVFGLGGIIESFAEKEARASWAKEAAYWAQWLGKKNA